MKKLFTILALSLSATCFAQQPRQAIFEVTSQKHSTGRPFYHTSGDTLTMSLFVMDIYYLLQNVEHTIYHISESGSRVNLLSFVIPKDSIIIDPYFKYYTARLTVKFKLESSLSALYLLIGNNQKLNLVTLKQPTSIEDETVFYDDEIVSIFDINGNKVESIREGFYIVLYKSGKKKKVFAIL